MQTPDTLPDEDNWLLDDEVDAVSLANSSASPRACWKILVVDDEKDVHTATRLAIADIRFKERGLELLNAFSGEEGFQLMLEHPQVALILLDVVMETDDAGLKLVQRIRNELGNNTVRIVLRTGQPGQAPEQKVILDYDINDYKTKTELTVQKLFTTVVSSLRAYESLISIEKNRQGLAKILEGAADLYQLYSLKEFASGVLKQISAILDVGMDGILCVEHGKESAHRPQLEIIASVGAYETLAEPNDFSHIPRLKVAIQDAFREKKNIYRYPYDVLYICAQNGREFVIHFSPPWPLDDTERRLLEIFCQRLSAAYDNFYLYHQLKKAQEATVVALADLAEFRDTDTGDHVIRVQKLTDAIAIELRRLGVYPDLLTKEFMETVGMASILHDVGKVGTPDHILFKPGRLDPEERQIMEQHAPIGAQILQKASRMCEGVNYLSLGSEIAGGHHEHFNGNGYPLKLSGQQIPLSARIVAIVDVFDALMNKRPYKEPWTLAQTMEYIRSRAGTQFDPLIVDALVNLAENGQLASLLAPPPEQS